MSTWRDDLGKISIGGRRLIGASFRGVPFFVESVDRAGGRRGVLHEFPFRDDPFFEDHGRKARIFPILGYVLGNSYVEQKNALIEALDGFADPGELFHPYYGARKAVCVNFVTRESNRDGGFCAFEIEFVETPAQAATPVESADLVELTSFSADAASAGTQAAFAETYNPLGMPGFALASAEQALAQASLAMRDALAPVARDAQELALLNSRVNILTADVASLVRQPGATLGAFLGALGALEQTIEDAPGAVLDALVETYSVDMGTDVIITTATRQRERDNQVSLQGAVRQLVAIEAARLAPRVPFESIEQAQRVRDAVAGQLEEQALSATDAAYIGLVQLRATVLRAVPDQSLFAREIQIERRVAMPSILISYQLYGNVDQEQDVVARNGARHPGFMSGFLRVLSSV